MNTQTMYYEKGQKWLDAEGLLSEIELAELEASYQDWIKKTLTNEPLEWDWELNPTIIMTDDEIEAWEVSLREGFDSVDWARNPEPDEDLYTDLDPDWDEYCETGRLY